ncbi:hypothetical protein AAFF_G00182530, partial [Aldrovandia affinis]
MRRQRCTAGEKAWRARMQVMVLCRGAGGRAQAAEDAVLRLEVNLQALKLQARETCRASTKEGERSQSRQLPNRVHSALPPLSSNHHYPAFLPRYDLQREVDDSPLGQRRCCPPSERPRGGRALEADLFQLQ